jgi:energy-coupling factor transport system substrate-specific component
VSKFNSKTNLAPVTRFISLSVLSLIGVLALGWPFIADPDSILARYATQTPWLMALLVPIAITLVAANTLGHRPDARSIAILALLIALITAVRPLGAGTVGLEPVWAVVIIGARALGPSLGFALGSLGLLTSALVTGGVGPWLPFQMLVAGWVGLGAALVFRKTHGRAEVLVLTGYSLVAGVAIGWLLNLWFWPVSTSGLAGIGYDPSVTGIDLLMRWVTFSLVTSLSFDIPRALLTGLLVGLIAGPTLRVIRRATRKISVIAPEPSPKVLGQKGLVAAR